MTVNVTKNLTVVLPESLVQMHQLAYPGEVIDEALLKLYLTACFGIVRINEASVEVLLNNHGKEMLCNQLIACMEEDCELCLPKKAE